MEKAKSVGKIPILTWCIFGVLPFTSLHSIDCITSLDIKSQNHTMSMTSQDYSKWDFRKTWRSDEYADQMAKEAAEEAKDMTELPPIVTMGDVKTAARESGKMKWQDMWDKTEKGRHLFNYRNKVGLNLEHKYQSTKGEISVIQLRTGYVRLNEYLQKTNAVESNKCQCSQIESIGHYLLECPLYENQREKLRRKLFETCGIVHLDLNLLLDVKADDDYKEWRTLILSELETFVAETKRFATRPSCQ